MNKLLQKIARPLRAASGLLAFVVLSAAGFFILSSGRGAWATPDQSPLSDTLPTPTVITLVSFTATAHDGYVLVEWETATELSTVGFNLWRSEAKVGPYTQLNARLIPAQLGWTTGASYSYDDDAVTYGVTYWYKLEEVDVHGDSTFHGPVVAMARWGYRLYLPLFLKSR